MRRVQLQAAMCGSLSAAAGLAASELPGAASGGFPSLAGAVGQEVVRSAPGGVVRLATDTAGTADKPLLLAAIVVVALLVGATTGPLALGRPLAVDLLTAATAGAGHVAATAGGAGATRAMVPAVFGALTSIGCRRASLAALAPPGPARAGSLGVIPRSTPALGSTSTRRGFLTAGSVAAGSAAVAVAGDVVLRGDGRPRRRPGSSSVCGWSTLPSDEDDHPPDVPLLRSLAPWCYRAPGWCRSRALTPVP